MCTVEVKTGKELLETIYYEDAQKRINLYKGTDSLVVWCDNNAYIIGYEMGSDFHTISEFLNYRIRMIGFEKFTHEIDSTEFDYITELHNEIDEGDPRGYLHTVLEESYHMEDLSNE
ncbi:hypothetical protein [Lactobacillus gasseri]|uniref:hypothetical protein n=1 Tax=Lactobacillus gasseri TaxID=1596 RepID=UPI0021533C40|nr:hypothetical protein [Lactobacillus gasseri]